MKNLFRILLLGVMAGAGSILASCTNPGNEITDIQYKRVLTPLNFTATVVPAAGNEIAFSWSAMQNADAYMLEVYTDPEDIEGSLVDDFEVVVTPDDPLPYLVGELDVDTEYYARVRGVSETLEPSLWAYLSGPAITFAVAPNLHPTVTDRTMTSVAISWDGDNEPLNLNSIRVEAVSADIAPVTIELSDSDKTAATKIIEGLDPATEYKFTMIFGLTGQRGSVAAWTRPDTSGTTPISTADELFNHIDGATGDVKLLLAYNDGTPYDMTAHPELPVGCNLYLYGDATADGKKPVITGFDGRLAAGSTAVHFEDLVLDGAGVGSLVENNGAALTAFEVINCEMFGYAHRLYYAGSNNGATCTSFLVDGLYAHDINPDGTSGGDFIDLRYGSAENIKLLNSTFSFLARTFMRLDAPSTVNTIEVRNCTFNAVTATTSASNNNGIFAVRSKGGGADFTVTSFTVNNNLFLNEVRDGDTWVRLVRDNASDTYTPTFSKNYYYNYGSVFFTSRAPGFSKEAAMTDGGEFAADPCVNSIGGKLYLSDPTIVANKIGDPRWWTASEPVIDRADELTVVTEDTVWDFTEKTVWDTETLPSPNGDIIENLEFYATAAVPTEIVMGEGVKFSTKGNVNADNVPSTSALGFLVDAVGTVRVTATGATPGTTYSVLVGSDNYPLIADGQPHAVVLGDISGETMIYIVAGAAMTVTQVEWLTTLQPDPTTAPLATPEVVFNPNRVDEGYTEEVVASWDAVPNAASYDVSFNGGAVQNQATTSFTAPGGLTEGDYEISVVAKPLATSTKFTPSEAGTASFRVVKVVVGEPVTETWDFSAASFDDTYDLIGTENTYVETTVWEDMTINGANKIKVGTSDDYGRYIQPGGAGNMTQRNFSFTAPASGTLKVWASNTGNTEDPARMVTVNVDGVETSKAGGTAGNTPPTICEFEITITEAMTVTVYPTGSGLRFYKLEYTYVAPNAPDDKAYNISDYPEATSFTAETVILNDLTVLAASSGNVDIDANNKSIDDYSFTKRLKLGGTSDSDGTTVPTYRAVKFSVEGACTITVYGMSGSSGTPRTIRISNGTQVLDESFTNDGTAIGKGTYSYTGGAGSIYLTSTSGGFNIYGIIVDYP